MIDILPTPKEIIDKLDETVIGQAEAKRSLAIIAYSHYLRILGQDSGVLKHGVSQHSILIGSTGVGKSLLVKTLAEVLDVPLLYINAPSLSSEGYIGESVGDCFARLCVNEKDPIRLNRTIVFIDEIDKLTKSERAAEVKGSAVQQELLIPLDGALIERISESNYSKPYKVDTRNFLFIGAGAFVGLDKIVASRVNAGSMGFLSGKDSSKNPTLNKTLEVDINQVMAEDLEKYGFIPEFIGRFRNIIKLNELTNLELKQTITDSSISPLNYYRWLYNLHNSDFDISEDFLDYLVEESKKSKTGARGIVSILDKLLQRKLLDFGSSIQTKRIKYNFTRENYNGTDFETPLTLNETNNLEASALNELKSRFSSKNEKVKKSNFPEIEEKELEIDNEYLFTESDNKNYDVSEEAMKELRDSLDFNKATKSAQKWWIEFEKVNLTKKPVLIYYLVSELKKRDATINEFFLAYVYSEIESIAGNLHYLDFSRSNNKSIDKSSAKKVKLSNLEKANLKTINNYLNSSAVDRYYWEYIEQQVTFSKNSLDYLTDRFEHGLQLKELSFEIACSQTKSIDALVSWLKYKTSDFKIKELVSDFCNKTGYLEEKIYFEISEFKRKIVLKYCNRLAVSKVLKKSYDPKWSLIQEPKIVEKVNLKIEIERIKCIIKCVTICCETDFAREIAIDLCEKLFSYMFYEGDYIDPITFFGELSKSLKYLQDEDLLFYEHRRFFPDLSKLSPTLLEKFKNYLSKAKELGPKSSLINKEYNSIY